MTTALQTKFNQGDIVRLKRDFLDDSYHKGDYLVVLWASKTSVIIENCNWWWDARDFEKVIAAEFEFVRTDGREILTQGKEDSFFGEFLRKSMIILIKFEKKIKK